MSTAPTFDEEIEFAAAHFKHLFPDADVSKGSPNWLWLASQSAGVTSNNANTENTKSELLPDTAIDLLDRWGNIKGLARKGATPSRKSKALRVVGTVGTAVPNNRALVHGPTGLQFQTASADVEPAGGFVDVDVVAVDVGSQTRLSKGEILTFVVPVAGLEEACELQLDMDEDGDDSEPNGDYRSRQLKAWRDPPLGGARADYEKWLTDITGIASAYVYPNRIGVGTVDVAALHKGSGSDRELQAGEITSAQAVLDAQRPIGAKASRLLTAVASAPVSVEYTVIDNGDLSSAFDWNDAVPPIAAAWNPATRTLQFGAARPASMQAGHRIVNGNGATAKERVIEALSGADTVILEIDATGDVPVALDTFYSGGPLVQPIRAAIQALADSLGTANPDAKRYGPWEGNLRPGAINRVASAIAGVLDGTVVAPGATVEASDLPVPDDGTVGFLILGRILVRKQH